MLEWVIAAWAWILLALLAGVPVTAVALVGNHWWRGGRDLARTARTLGLRIESRLGIARRVVGTLGGYEVEIRRSGRIDIDAGRTLPSQFSLVAHQGTAGVVTGDPAFDQHYRIDAHPVLALGLVGPDVRKQLLTRDRPDRRSLPGRPRRHLVRVASGHVVVDGTIFPSLLAAMDFAMALTETFHDPPDPAARLAGALRHCPTLWERLAVLRALADHCADQPAGRVALQDASTDANEEARLIAASGLGEETVGVLAQIAERRYGDETRPARALRELGERYPVESVMECLSQSLRRRRHVVAEAAIECLATRTDASITGRLTAILDHGSESLSVAAARALGVRGDVDAEQPLLAALEGDRRPVSAAAAEALGKMGTAAAVLPLLRAVESGSRAVGRAARAAVVAIQSRLGDADVGQVALADVIAGEVSIVDAAPRGRLSLHE